MQISTNNIVTENNKQTTQKTTNKEDENISFSDSLKKDKDLIKEDTTQKLIDDILSILRTGFTISELELLEKLLQQIAKLRKEQDSNNISDKKIDAMIKSLEQAILQLKKRVNGEAIIEAEEEIGVQNKENTPKNTLSFDERIEKIKIDLLDFKQAKKLLEKLTSSNNYEKLELIQEFKKKI